MTTRFRHFALLVCFIVVSWPAELACTNIGDPPNPGDVFPLSDDIAQKARDYLVQRMGEEFVSEYVTYDPERSQTYIPWEDPSGGGHSARFTVDVAGRPFAHWDIQIVMERDGTYRFHNGGIPWCAKWPKECEFPIDEDEAKRIATALGLGQGLYGMRARFSWDNESGFTWRITNTEFRTDDGKRGGYRVVVDANEGFRIEGPRRYGAWPDGE